MVSDVQTRRHFIQSCSVGHEYIESSVHILICSFFGKCSTVCSWLTPFWLFQFFGRSTLKTTTAYAKSSSSKECPSTSTVHQKKSRIVRVQGHMKSTERVTPNWCRICFNISVAFSVYDFNSDGYITKEEIAQLLKSCFTSKYSKVNTTHAESLATLASSFTSTLSGHERRRPRRRIERYGRPCPQADSTWWRHCCWWVMTSRDNCFRLQVADKDKDNRLSRADFKVAVMKNYLLTEILGKWMPNEDVSTFTEYTCT